MKSAGPLLVLGGIAAVVGYVLMVSPTAEQEQRIDVCRKWGVSDNAKLSQCRESSEKMDVVISPIRRPRVVAAINEFNAELSDLAPHRTVVDTSTYEATTLSDLSHVIGLAPIVQTDKLNDIPQRGHKYKVAAVLDWSVPEENERWAPRSYKLMDLNNVAFVEIDIESLNRYEREFINEHCTLISPTPCTVTVYGTVDEIRDQRVAIITSYGLVVDQIDFTPLDPASAR